MNRQVGVIFDIKRFAIHDGGGIRSTLFIKGCPLQCPWCHNPEGRNKGILLIWYATLCIGCGRCARICEYGAVKINDLHVSIDRKKCILCGKCVETCPPLALKMIGREITAEEAVQELLKDRAFYTNSNGGVTLSGGDPMFQKNFSLSVLKLSKEKGLHTIIETCLFAEEKTVLEFLEVTDQFIVDIKIFDDNHHKKIVGMSNKLILRNFNSLVRHHADILVRIPLIPGYTDDDENIIAIAKYIAADSKSINVELLNYNALAANKYITLGETYLPGRNTKPLSLEVFERKKMIVRNILERDDEGVLTKGRGWLSCLHFGFATRI